MILARCDGAQDRIKGKLVGAYAYLIKPFKADHFAAAIRTSLEETVSVPAETVRLGEREVVSSQDNTRSRTPTKVFPPRCYGIQ